MRKLIPALVVFMLLCGVLFASASGTASADTVCTAALESIWTAASDACIGKPAGFICNGGLPPAVEPQGTVSGALAPLGALVEAGLVQAMRTAPLQIQNSGGISTAGGGILYLRAAEPIRYTGLMVGGVTLYNVTPVGFPAWQSIVAITDPAPQESCPDAPRPAFIAQTPFGQPTNIAINGVSVGLNGTLLVQTESEQTIFAALAGQASIFAGGLEQVLRAGQETAVGHAGGSFITPVTAPAAPAPMQRAQAAGLPVGLFDRPVSIPQPGFAVTGGLVNLRTEPSTGAPLLLEIQAGQALSVLGRNSAGDWLHVRLDSGETGWAFAPLLILNTGAVERVYEATPLPPQRYGLLGTTGIVIAPAGVALRTAPDGAFPAIASLAEGTRVRLLARSPYSPWLKVDSNGTQGWLALLTLETQAVIEALPIDFNVPPPPTPTRIPGSFGNAFPDPNRGG